MRKRDEWLDLARKLDWDFTYVTEKDVYPEAMSGRPWLPHAKWAEWDEPYRTTFTEYVTNQRTKEASVGAVREVIGNAEDFEKLDPSWLSGLKLHAATLPLAEFGACIGNLRAARFGRDSAWRIMATFGALDELRHTQIPLLLMHDLVAWNEQFDWTHKFYHTKNWLSVATRHLLDELLLTSDAIEFSVATHFVLETGFTNLQFVGLSSLAHDVGDRMFEKMVNSIQTDEARHAQIGPAVLAILVQHDRPYAQALVDKWFWRTWHLFAVVTGFTMDYLTPLAHRTASFKEFMEEWILDQFENNLKRLGLEKPWYWNQFLEAIEIYHHMAYASAYTYRLTTWFDFVVPSPEERAWLARKYPKTWHLIDPVWERIADRWRSSGPGVEAYSMGTTPFALCDLCQMTLSGGVPIDNTAQVIEYDKRKYIFCSEPCFRIFSREPERYAEHRSIPNRMLAGDAPANQLALIREYFELGENVWGKDIFSGAYPWLKEHP